MFCRGIHELGERGPRAFIYAIGPCSLRNIVSQLLVTSLGSKYLRSDEIYILRITLRSARISFGDISRTNNLGVLVAPETILVARVGTFNRSVYCHRYRDRFVSTRSVIAILLSATTVDKRRHVR